MSVPPSSDGGGESPIFYPLDTPNVGSTLVKSAGEGLSRRGSTDDGYRRFVRASSEPGGLTPAAKESGKLTDEPNPFEVSFKDPSDSRQGRRARSQSPKSAKATPLIAGMANKLGNGAVASPSPTHGTGMSHYSWNMDSLRSMSPSILGGNHFDPSSMRTGLTPQIGGHSWGPDTPGTAAFFASLGNGHTPGMSGTLDPGVRHREDPNHFEATFARAMSQPNGVNGLHAALTANGGHALPFSTQSMPRPMQPAYLQHSVSQPAISGAYGQNGLHLLSHGVSQHELGDVADDAFMAAAALSNLQTTPIATYNQPTSTAPDNINGPVEAEGEQHMGRGARKRSATSASLNAADGGMYDESPPASVSGSGRKRKSTANGSSATKRGSGKRAKAITNDFDEDDDIGMFDDEDDVYLEDADIKPAVSKGGRGHKKNETDEEKRKSFLERNRQAALKCRQRKKAWLQSLQSKVEFLTADNETLQSTVNSLREEIAALRAVLVAHKDCPVQMPNGGPQTTVGAMLQQYPLAHSTGPSGHR